MPSTSRALPDSVTGNGVEIGSLTNLLQLSFYSNKMTGAIPEELGNLTELRELYLGDNQFTGKIPNSFKNLNKLELLRLDQNKLSGELPTLFFESFPYLKNIDLTKNNLSDNIPDDLNGCDSLIYFFIGDNQFMGAIPSTLKSLKHLSRVYCYNNHFTSIPDFSSTPMDTSYFMGNKLTFRTLEANAGKAGFFYTPQDSIPLYGKDFGGSLHLWVNAGGNFSKYDWFKKGTPLSGGDTIIIASTENPSDYRCEITNTSLPDLTLYTLPFNGLEAVRNEDKLFAAVSVTPNIISGSGTISFNLLHSENITIRMYDISSRLVKTILDARVSEGLHSQRFDCSDVASGNYTISIESPSGVSVHKLIVLK